MNTSKRPVFLIGEGCRYADLTPVIDSGVPVLSSWQAADLIDNHHSNYFGRPGVYGQRCANKILYEADTVIAIGCRMSPFTIGHAGFRPEQKVVMCDIDQAELNRFPDAEHYHEHADVFIGRFGNERVDCFDWQVQCFKWREKWPWQEHAETTPAGYIDAYAFVDHLSALFRPDEVIVTDMGTALCAAFQVLRLKPPQRLLTSGGLGEMGVALPAAIGASFARGKGEVICLHCDGGMMLNLQELQTIVHHRLPIKIIVFSNDGYVMLKHTQKVQGMQYSGVNFNSGVSCPDFALIGEAFGIDADVISRWSEVDQALTRLFDAKWPALLEVQIDPEQPLTPKLSYGMVNGVQQFHTFDQLSPLEDAHG